MMMKIVLFVWLVDVSVNNQKCKNTYQKLIIESMGFLSFDFLTHLGTKRCEILVKVWFRLYFVHFVVEH